MTALLILTLCSLNGECIEKAPFGRVESMTCAIHAQMMAADWLNENMHGWRLAGWRCQLGERKIGA